MPRTLRSLSLLVIALISLGVLPSSAAYARFQQSGMCVRYARALTNFEIYGDAWTWWHQAVGKYERGSRPAVGSVLVFRKTGHMRRGHVAVVSKMVDRRTVLVDHSWIAGHGLRRGMRVVDTSLRNDWSEVRVWHEPTRTLGMQRYPAHGFIYPNAPRTPKASDVLMAALPKPGAGGTGAERMSRPRQLAAVTENEAAAKARGTGAAVRQATRAAGAGTSSVARALAAIKPPALLVKAPLPVAKPAILVQLPTDDELASLARPKPGPKEQPRVEPVRLAVVLPKPTVRAAAEPLPARLWVAPASRSRREDPPVAEAARLEPPAAAADTGNAAVGKQSGRGAALVLPRRKPNSQVTLLADASPTDLAGADTAP